MSVIPLHFGFLFPLRRDGEACGEQPHNASPRMIRVNAEGGRELAASAVGGFVTERSDEKLIEAYIEGDRAAFEELMQRYRNELLHFLTRFLGSRAAGEDVFQETFLQIHLSAETFDSSRRFKPWLFTIAANKARDYHRKHHKRQPLSLSAPMGDEAEGQQYVDLMEADLPSPDEPVLDAERSRLVKQVVDSMPSHLREILLLSYFQRMSYNQIAEALEIPLGTVKSRLHTAVATFASAWKHARQTERVGGKRRDRDQYGDGEDDAR
jgi:RNA polymerase sigma-70 factor, ECF subfamily